MTSLNHYLEEASEEIEADIARWYPTYDLSDLTRWPSRLTHRKLAVFMDKLPEDSSWKTWIRDNVTTRLEKEPGGGDASEDFKGQPWSLLNRQIQGMRNDLHLGFYQLAAALGGSGGEEFKPPYTTPTMKFEVVEPEPQAGEAGVISLQERREMLEKVRRNRGWSSLRK